MRCGIVGCAVKRVVLKNETPSEMPGVLFYGVGRFLADSPVSKYYAQCNWAKK